VPNNRCARGTNKGKRVSLHNDQMGFVKRLKYEFEYTVKYYARLKSNQSLAGSDGVRQKRLGFNL
jgi:hypothetical protein